MATIQVSTHSRLKAAGNNTAELIQPVRVSTHSRLKAAGRPPESGRMVYQGFNTQPPKGGWPLPARRQSKRFHRFNTQPPKGGWFNTYNFKVIHNRFNTQPPKGGWLP